MSSPPRLRSSPIVDSTGALTEDDGPLIATLDSTSNYPNQTVEASPPLKSSIDGSKTTIFKRKKKKRRPTPDVSDPPSLPSCSASHSVQRGLRVPTARRNRVLIGCVRQKESNVETLALPLGMSIAAVVAQVLDKKSAARERISVDHLSGICALAVRESLANAFGNKFDCFVTNFERSFRSTLMTLRSINESFQSEGELLSHWKRDNCCSGVSSPISLNRGSSCNSGVGDCEPEAALHAVSTREQVSIPEETEENMPMNLMNRELDLHEGHTNQQLACVSPSSLPSVTTLSVLRSLEKSVVEQARLNNLKAIEIDLTMKKLQLKEAQLALNSDSNLLERCKLSMGISKASFKAERFKNQLEDTRHAELLKTSIDCLVAGLFIMLSCLAYGAYVFSHKRITEATASCAPITESKSWWIPKPMASFNSGLQVLRCQVQVLSRMLFGLLMILAIGYLLLQRSATPKQTMPITFILLLLGVICGIAGKFCVDTLGGSGSHWLIYWEALCSLHLFSNLCISTLFFLLNGPVMVSQGGRSNVIFPYRIRRFLFYATVLLVLPLSCGFMPFASPGEWKDHFLSFLITDGVIFV